jgi:ABC-2 type transport system ATP-binding protein
VTTPTILTTKLSKMYTVGFVGRKTVHALRELDFKVESGQIYGLLGPNGAGKSTTIKILLDLVTPTTGTAALFGQLPSSKEARRQVGFLPENPAPYEYLTGREFVTFAAELAGMTGASLKKRVGEVIDQVGMHDAAELVVRRYSKGMIQRISLAQALVSSPKLLVLDEPTSGLDVLGRQLVRDIVREQQKLGTTILLCSHIIPDVEALCDRVAVLVGGRLVREGSVSALLADSQSMMEATVTGLSAEAFEPLREKLKSIDESGGRVLLRFEERHAQEMVQGILTLKGQLTGLQRTRFTLEELFLGTIKESGRSVGSDIS